MKTDKERKKEFERLNKVANYLAKGDKKSLNELVKHEVGDIVDSIQDKTAMATQIKSDINHICRVMAEYIGARDPLGLHGDPTYGYWIGRGDNAEWLCKIKDWQPDKNAEQLDIVEEKAAKEGLITGSVWDYRSGEHGYKLLGTKHKIIKVALHKTLARFFALSQLIEKEKT